MIIFLLSEKVIQVVFLTVQARAVRVNNGSIAIRWLIKYINLLISVADFLHVYEKPNSNGIFKEIIFKNYFKNATSALFPDFKPNFLKKMRTSYL